MLYFVTLNQLKILFLKFFYLILFSILKMEHLNKTKDPVPHNFSYYFFYFDL